MPKFLLTSLHAVLCQRSQGGGGRSAWLSALAGDMSAVRRALDSGQSADSPNGAGLTLLHAAALGGHVGVAKMLVEAGANANAESDGGETPMHVASANGHLPVR